MCVFDSPDQTHTQVLVKPYQVPTSNTFNLILKEVRALLLRGVKM